MKYLKWHLETRFPNLLANSKNLTFLHIFPARQAEDCAHSVRNGRSEHTQLSNGLLASPERPKWDLLFLVTSGQCVGRSYSPSDWLSKWCEMIHSCSSDLLVLWGAQRRQSSLRHLFKVYFRFGGAWVLLFRMLLSNLVSSMLHYKQPLVFCFQTQKCPLFPPPLYNVFQPQTLLFHYPWHPVWNEEWLCLARVWFFTSVCKMSRT